MVPPINVSAGQPGGRSHFVMGASTAEREQRIMLAVLAAVAFLVAALLVFLSAAGLPTVVALIAVGLGMLALHMAYPWTPWRRAA
jgi:fatty acid desaturase